MAVGGVEQETAFFRSWGGSWDTDYGAFFMGWYSDSLLAHGERLMAAAADVFNSDPGQDPALAQPSSPSGGGGGFTGDIFSHDLAFIILRLPTVKHLSETIEAMFMGEGGMAKPTISALRLPRCGSGCIGYLTAQSVINGV